MTRILVSGEDALTCSLGERIVEHALPGWSLARDSVNTGGVTKLVAALGRYAEVARHLHPVLCVADADRGCAAELRRRWMPLSTGAGFLLRIAVSESESWALGDRVGFSAFLGISSATIAPKPEELADAKAELLRLVRRSRRRMLRDEMLAPGRDDRAGPGYNAHLTHFVRERWLPERAAENCPSLLRAIRRVKELARTP